VNEKEKEKETLNENNVVYVSWVNENDVFFLENENNVFFEEISKKNVCDHVRVYYDNHEPNVLLYHNGNIYLVLKDLYASLLPIQLQLYVPEFQNHQVLLRHHLHLYHLRIQQMQSLFLHHTGLFFHIFRIRLLNL